MAKKMKRAVVVIPGKEDLLEVLKKLLSKHLESRDKGCGKQ